MHAPTGQPVNASRVNEGFRACMPQLGSCVYELIKNRISVQCVLHPCFKIFRINLIGTSFSLGSWAWQSYMIRLIIDSWWIWWSDDFYQSHNSLLKITSVAKNNYRLSKDSRDQLSELYEGFLLKESFGLESASSQPKSQFQHLREIRHSQPVTGSHPTVAFQESKVIIPQVSPRKEYVTPLCPSTPLQPTDPPPHPILPHTTTDSREPMHFFPLWISHHLRARWSLQTSVLQPKFTWEVCLIVDSSIFGHSFLKWLPKKYIRIGRYQKTTGVPK